MEIIQRTVAAALEEGSYDFPLLLNVVSIILKISSCYSAKRH